MSIAFAICLGKLFKKNTIFNELAIKDEISELLRDL